MMRISASVVIANADIVDRKNTKQARTLAAKMKRDAKRKKRAMRAICA